VAIARAMEVPEERVQLNLALQRRIFAAVREESDPDTRRERVTAVLRRFLEETPGGGEALGIPAAAEQAWIEGQVASTTSPWFRFFLSHDPRDDLRRVRVPVLALNGGKDLQVPPAENLAAIRQALDEAGNTHATILELPRLNHLFQTAGTGAPAEYARIEETFAPAALEAISSWILRLVPGR
jgi:fermentation-respiration switch protein FrsA (DUF1100 family)